MTLKHSTSSKWAKRVAKMKDLNSKQVFFIIFIFQYFQKNSLPIPGNSRTITKKSRIEKEDANNGQ